MGDKSRIDSALRQLLPELQQKPVVALVLGSGLGDFADLLLQPKVVRTSQVPGYPCSTTQGHEGSLVFGSLRQADRTSLPLLVFKGRIHYYETAELDSIVFPVHLAARLGVRALIVTNAAGGASRGLAAGDLMLITDLINLAFLCPQVETQRSKGKFLSRTGRIELFDSCLQDVLRESARAVGVTLREGTYCWLRGPAYETRSEIEMLRRVGVDAVGMSTFPEVIAAKELGMRVAGISLISNLAAGIAERKLSHDEVTETAARVREPFARLLSEALLRIRL